MHARNVARIDIYHISTQYFVTYTIGAQIRVRIPHTRSSATIGSKRWGYEVKLRQSSNSERAYHRSLPHREGDPMA